MRHSINTNASRLRSDSRFRQQKANNLKESGCRPVIAGEPEGTIHDFRTSIMQIRSNYHPDALWDIWVKTPEMIAEMDTEERKQYGHIAFVDYNSTGYICRQLINAVDPYEYGIDRKDLVFIVRIC